MHRIDENRKKEMIDVCLQTFITNGLSNTTARDLSRALEIQTGTLYYHFDNKDAIVLACANEATTHLETELFLAAMDYLTHPEERMQEVMARAKRIAPAMKFFAQVCMEPQYRADIQPALERMETRHCQYAIQFAQRLNCPREVIEPYLYNAIALFVNYMIFNEELYFEQPLQAIKQTVLEIQTTYQTAP